MTAEVAPITTYPTLEQITTQSGEICDSLNGRPMNIDRAKEASQTIYQYGLQLIQSEFTQSSHRLAVTPVIVDLNKAILLEAIQHHPELYRSLVKTHRVFLELMWYRCWDEERLKPTLESTIAQINQVATRVKDLFPTKTYRGRDAQEMTPVDVRFEAQCISEATKYLTPTQKEWRKYLSYVKKIAPAAAAVAMAAASPACPPLIIGAIALPVGIEVIKAAMKLTGVTVEFGAELKNEMSASWYHDVWSLRWLATNIKTAEQFEEHIQPLINEFCSSGEKYSLGVATVLMDIIKNNPAEEQSALRAKALSGGDEYLGLTELVSYEKSERKDFLPWFNPRKRRKKTRQLATYYLSLLVRDPTLTREQRIKCGRVLKNRLSTILNDDENILHTTDERDFLATKLRELRDKKDEVQRRKQEAENELDMYDDAGNPIRGTEITLTLEQAESQLDECEKEEQVLDVSINNVEESLAEDDNELKQDINKEKDELAKFLEQFPDET